MQDLTTKKMIGLGKEHDGLYYLVPVTEDFLRERGPRMAAAALSSTLDLWHKHLGHLSTGPMHVCSVVVQNFYPCILFLLKWAHYGNILVHTPPNKMGLWNANIAIFLLLPVLYVFKHKFPSSFGERVFSAAYIINRLPTLVLSKRSPHEANLDPRWREAMTAELQALEQNHTWTLTSLPHGKRSIGSR
ncbi:unnamed protein product [Prunus armeniaca]